QRDVPSQSTSSVDFLTYFFGDVGSLPVMPRPPLPVAADAVTRPLSQAAENSVCVSLPSLLLSAALKSVTTPCAWVCETLPDFEASSLVHAAVQSARLIFDPPLLG